MSTKLNAYTKSLCYKDICPSFPHEKKKKKIPTFNVF